ncbi:EF-P beta-lysylation protein EpmB [Luteimonas vadosa]|uniref:L-lysine 2,3-aminomutase n=2 Tax=Luteimonas vadosa TaxID=1165507 RepID=A0ABP9E501_9GAMM
MLPVAARGRTGARTWAHMIPAAPLSLQPPRWQQALREAVRDPRELLAMLGLQQAAMAVSPEAAAQFPLKVPRGFVARMRPGDPHDPLLRQVLPLDDEMRPMPGFTSDAVGDAAARAGHGVLHKYAGRALLVSTGSCAIHCRYCFRRHFPYAEETAAAGGWQDAVAAVRADESITEVILSGGDPLSLATAKLSELTTQLAALPHLRRLRIHTRLPVVLPARVDDGLVGWLQGLPWPSAVVLHANHANEFDAGVDEALGRLRAAGASLLNQAVLLRGVNDSTGALAALCERGFMAGVLPYYLHQLDRVAGAAHFEVTDARARRLHGELVERLPGYLVPRLVREVAGDASKRPLSQG